MTPTVLLMAIMLVGEAGGDCTKAELKQDKCESMALVASVALNRAKAWHETPRQAIVRPRAFYGLKNGLYDKADTQLKQIALKISKEALENKIKDKTGGALYFINPKHENPFKWCKIKTYQYKNHVFYK